jgi:hypothetical protein
VRTLAGWVSGGTDGQVHGRLRRSDYVSNLRWTEVHMCGGGERPESRGGEYLSARHHREPPRDLHKSRRVTFQLSIEGGHTHNKSQNAGMRLKMLILAFIPLPRKRQTRIRGKYVHTGFRRIYW